MAKANDGFGPGVNWNDPAPEVLAEIERRKAEVHSGAFAAILADNRQRARKAQAMLADPKNARRIGIVAKACGCVTTRELRELVAVYGAKSE
jgi:hypothetical protein